MLEAYSVGVRISLINKVSQGLAMMAKDVGVAEAKVARLQNRFAGLQSTIMKAGLFFGAGMAGLLMFKAPIEEASKLHVAMTRLKALGIGDEQFAQATKFARAMDVYGMSITDKVATFKDAYSVFNDLAKAKLVAPVISQMLVANKALYGEEVGTKNLQGALPLLKVAELRGGLADQAKLLTEMNAAERAYIASGGLVNQQQLLNAMKTGGIPLKLMNAQTLYAASEPILQEMGGYRFGTGMLAIYNNLLQGRSSQRAVKEMERLGLVNPKMIEYSSIGSILRMKPGALFQSDLLKSDYVKYLTDVLLPAFRAHGITTQSQIMDEIGAIVGNSRGANVLSTTYFQLPAIARAMQRVGGAADIAQTYAAARTTLPGAYANLSAQWKTLLADIGMSVLPNVTSGINLFADSLRYLDGVITAHPAAMKTFAGGVAALSAAAMGRGVWIMAAGLLRFTGVTALLASPFGLAATAIAGIGFAAYELWDHWSEVKKALGSFFGWLDAKTHELMSWLGLNRKPSPAIVPNAHTVAAMDWWGKTLGSAWTAFSGFEAAARARQTGLVISPTTKASMDWMSGLLGSAAGSVSDFGATVRARDYTRRFGEPGPVPTTSMAPGTFALTRNDLITLADRVGDKIVQKLGNVQLNMDGRTVGQMVSKQLGDLLDRPSTGPSGYDTKMMPLRPDFAQ